MIFHSQYLWIVRGHSPGRDKPEPWSSAARPLLFFFSSWFYLSLLLPSLVIRPSKMPPDSLRRTFVKHSFIQVQHPHQQTADRGPPPPGPPALPARSRRKYFFFDHTIISIKLPLELQVTHKEWCIYASALTQTCVRPLTVLELRWQHPLRARPVPDPNLCMMQ